MTDSRLFRFIVRVLQLLPAILLACAVIGLGIEFLQKPLDQLIPVQSALNGR